MTVTEKLTVSFVTGVCSKLIEGDLFNATRLWNLIDRSMEPEPLWAVMQHMVPWAFQDARDANSMLFTY